jgi:hypothetical protein
MDGSRREGARVFGLGRNTIALRHFDFDSLKNSHSSVKSGIIESRSYRQHRFYRFLN